MNKASVYRLSLFIYAAFTVVVVLVIVAIYSDWNRLRFEIDNKPKPKGKINWEKKTKKAAKFQQNRRKKCINM